MGQSRDKGQARDRMRKDQFLMCVSCVDAASQRGGVA